MAAVYVTYSYTQNKYQIGELVKSGNNWYKISHYEYDRFERVYNWYGYRI